MKSITANELSNMVASGKNIDLIDVRTPMEFRAMHVTIARNEPLSGLDPRAIHRLAMVLRVSRSMSSVAQWSQQASVREVPCCWNHQCDQR